MPDLETELSEELIDAYKATNFEVLSNPKFIIKVDEYCEGLSKLFQNTGYENACFITAYNPASVELTSDQNQLAQSQLHSDLTQIKTVILDGIGNDPNGLWEGEPSFLILGISLNDAKKIGIKYAQNAFVWCDENCIPELVLLK